LKLAREAERRLQTEQPVSLKRAGPGGPFDSRFELGLRAGDETGPGARTIVITSR